MNAISIHVVTNIEAVTNVPLLSSLSAMQNFLHLELSYQHVRDSEWPYSDLDFGLDQPEEVRKYSACLLDNLLSICHHLPAKKKKIVTTGAFCCVSQLPCLVSRHWMAEDSSCERL